QGAGYKLKTAFVKACGAGQEGIMDFLINEHACDRFAQEGLTAAAQSGHAKIVRKLLEETKSDVDLDTLVAAYESGNAELVAELEREADTEVLEWTITLLPAAAIRGGNESLIARAF